MAKLSEVFPSKWLTASDLDDADLVVTISKVEIQQFEDDGKKSSKPVLNFKETDKGFVCNLTNSRTIEAMYGDDTDDWEGQRITLFPTDVQYGAKMVPAIRIRPRKPKDKVKPAKPIIPSTDDDDDDEPVVVAAKPAKVAKVAKPADDDDDDDDEIPF